MDLNRRAPSRKKIILKLQFKKIFLLAAFSLCAFTYVFSQRKLFKDGAEDKYFVAFSYGIGSANWNSKLGSSALYDTSGAELFAGDIKFKAKNTLRSLNFDVSAPVLDVRMGMGICFEEFYLEKIKINDVQYFFADKFRFEKLYAQIEIPIKKWSTANFSFNVKSQAGYYGYSFINHINLFGMENKASVLFMNSGFLADYKIYPHSYIFIHPVAEYKYFRSSSREMPSLVLHNIWSFAVQFGLRFDISRE